MNPCLRPLDPIDAEALAAGAPPLLAPDAADHTRACAACGAAVAEAVRLSSDLDELRETPAGPDLTQRVLRLRAFSRRERREFALWRGPSVLAGILFAAGFLLLLWPGLSGREQASLGLAALAPLLALLRAAVRSLTELARVAPASLEALAEVLRGERTVGFAALFLLAPLTVGFKHVLARAARRR